MGLLAGLLTTCCWIPQLRRSWHTRSTRDISWWYLVTLGGGSLAFHTIHLMPHAATPAKIAVTGDVNVGSLTAAGATIANGAGTGSSGFVDLSGGNRNFTVADGAAA